MNTPLTVGMIGCGGRAREHVPALLADERCRITALADVKTENADSLNTDFALGAAVYNDYREMLALSRPDVVVLCLWTGLHLPVFRACVEAGVRAVLSEKPMAPTYGECVEMAELAAQSGCQLTFCHQRRYSPGNLLAREWIRAGRFGDILRLDLYSVADLMDCGTHTFDQAFSFLGEAPVKWVLGAPDTSDTVNYFGVRAEAMFVGTLVYESGVRAVIQTGGPDMDMWAGVRVTGTDGFADIMWDGQWKRMVLYREPGATAPDTECPPGVQMRGYVRDALDCLASGAEPETSARKALRAAEVIFAFYESARRRARITLPLTGVSDNPVQELLPEA